MVYVGIFIVLAIIFWNLDKITDLKRKFRINDNKVYQSTDKKHFSVSINYHVSAILHNNFKKVVAISFTVINKTVDMLKNIKVAVPGYKVVDIRSMDTPIQMDHPKLGQLLPIGGDIDPLEIRSGYLLLEVEDEKMEPATLVVMCDNEATEVPVRSEQILDEKVLQFL